MAKNDKTGLFKDNDAVINANVTVHGNILRVEVDLSKDFGLSKSGKSITVAGTGGFQRIPGVPASFNLNVIRKP